MSEVWVYGIHAVQAALKANRVESLWLDRSRHDKRMTQLLELAGHNVATHYLERPELEQRLTQTLGGHKPGNAPVKHQGVLARLKPQVGLDESGLLQWLQQVSEQGRPPLVLALDGVQDPHNLGACLRSADAAGVHVVIAPRDRSVDLTPVVRKVACGAAEALPFVTVTNLARTLEQLKQMGLWTVGLDGAAEQSLYEHDLRGPVVLVLGAEGQGLRRLTKEKCDFLAQLPMAGVVESLNVSVATGICLFEAVRQRL
ncbi:MAG: 23S rRNA (guanosine(2251)-2'-O)-methyltransferase RlmB [Gammaproteobacteria bacterium]|nr:23S rRNA (guanosine(2251)-2'-O)-methyltransferase RlmB [Gammaproteobacteria bacterium]MDH5803405.1 23S rRNA (guanosine(2251)-2'-O)-methyltransferase RlmB [Gammaproteobacteria bacterium]